MEVVGKVALHEGESWGGVPDAVGSARGFLRGQRWGRVTTPPSTAIHGDNNRLPICVHRLVVITVIIYHNTLPLGMSIGITRLGTGQLTWVAGLFECGLFGLFREKYFITFSDDFFALWIYLFQEKSQAGETVEYFMIEVQRQLNRKVKII